MNSMMVERLGSVSLRGGVVRVQCMATGADGEEYVTGELHIPAAQFGQVSGALQNAGRELQQRLEQARKDQSEQPEQ